MAYLEGEEVNKSVQPDILNQSSHHLLTIVVSAWPALSFPFYCFSSEYFRNSVTPGNPLPASLSWEFLNQLEQMATEILGACSACWNTKITILQWKWKTKIHSSRDYIFLWMNFMPSENSQIFNVYFLLWTEELLSIYLLAVDLWLHGDWIKCKSGHDQPSPIELSVMIEMFNNLCCPTQYPHWALKMWLARLRIWIFYFILINLNLNLSSHVWLSYWTMQF